MTETIWESDVTCKVCGLGKIITRTNKKIFAPRTIGEIFKRKEPEQVDAENVIYCNACGVIYEFLPQKEVKVPTSDKITIQINPWCWVGRPGTTEKFQNVVKAFMAEEGIDSKEALNAENFRRIVEGAAKIVER